MSYDSDMELRIRFVDAGFSAGIEQTKAQMSSLDGPAKELATNWGLIGTHAEAAGQKMKKGAAEGSAGMGNLRHNAEMVRYEFEQLGIHAPRYLSSIAAESRGLLGVMTALSGVFIGIGAISMFGMAIKEAKDFYNAHLSLNAAMDEYNKKAAESAQKELFDKGSIETTLASLKDINNQLNAIESRKAPGTTDLSSMGDMTGWALSNFMGQQQDSKQQAGLSEKRDLAYDRTITQAAEQRKTQIEQDRAYFDQTHQGYAKIAGDKKLDLQLSEQQRQIEKARDKELQDKEKITRAQQEAQGITDPAKLQFVHSVDGTAGDAAAADRARGINQRAAGEGTELARRERDEVIRAQNEAINAGLRGESLYLHQREQSLAELARKTKESYGEQFAAVKEYQEKKAAIELKADNEHAERLRAQREETAELQMQAHMAGSTGAGRIRGEADLKEAQLGKQLDLGMDFTEYWKRRQAIEETATAEMKKDQQSFFDQVQSLSDASADHQVGAYARIRAQATRERDRLRKEYLEHVNQNPSMFPEYSAAYQRGQGAIGTSSADDIRALNQKNNDETLKLEQEAARKTMRPEQQKTQQIVDEYNERLRSYKRERGDELESTQLSAADKLQVELTYNRRVLAADKEKNAELKANAKEMQDKLAGQLEGLFKNPRDYFKNLGTHMMAEASAGMLLHLQQKLPNQVQGAAGDPSSFFSGILGGQWLGGKHAGGGAGIPGMSHAGHSMASSTLSISSATINIQSANINGGAGASAPGGGSTFSSGAEDVGAGAASMASGISGVAGAGGGAGSILSNVNQGFGLYSKMRSAFATTSGAAGANGPASDASAANAALQGATKGASGAGAGPSTAMAGNALQGGMGLYGASQGTGGVTGALGGAASGAEVGSMFGPIGAGVGAVAGGVIGALGSGAQAEAYWNKQVKPHLDQVQQSFSTGQVEYLDAYNDISKLESEALHQTSSMGFSGHRVYNNEIKPALDRELAQLTREAKAGRAQFSMSASQFHSGGLISGFGDLATSSDEGFIHAQRGEIVLNPQAAQTNAPLAHAMNSGLDYRDLMAPKMQPQQQRDVNLHFHSPDAKGVRRLLLDNAQHVRAALNSSYAEYSGGSDAGF